MYNNSKIKEYVSFRGCSAENKGCNWEETELLMRGRTPHNKAYFTAESEQKKIMEAAT